MRLFVSECNDSLRTFGLCCVLGHSGILGNEAVDAIAMLSSLSGGDLIVGPDPQSSTSTASSADRLGGNGSHCYVSRCLRLAVDSGRTGWLLSLGKASLRLVFGFITGHCEIRSLTKIWNQTIEGYVAMRRSWRLSSIFSVTGQPFVDPWQGLL